MWKHFEGTFNQKKALVGALSCLLRDCEIFVNFRLKLYSTPYHPARWLAGFKWENRSLSVRTGAISGGQAVTGTAIIIITYYYLHQNIDTGTDAAQTTLVITSND